MRKLIYKKILSFFILLLFLTNAKALNCNLEADELSENYTLGALEIVLYNPNETNVNIWGIEYYNGSNLVRKYDIIKSIGPRRALSFKHYTSEQFLKRIDAVNFDCSISKPRSLKQDISKIEKKDNSWFKWWYLLFIIPALGLISGFIEDSKKKINKTETKTQEKKVNRSKEHPGNLIEDIWDGKKSLGESFWLYFILINGIISFAAGFFSELNDNNFYLIPALISNIVTMVGVWNSSTNYQLSKIKKKQPYGWAYAAKVSVVLNGLSIFAQGAIILGIQ